MIQKGSIPEYKSKLIKKRKILIMCVVCVQFLLQKILMVVSHAKYSLFSFLIHRQ